MDRRLRRKLQTRRDVYNLDGRTLAAIKTERVIVEPPPQGKPEQEVASNSGRRKVVAQPRTMSLFQSFFFGAPARPARGIYR